MWGALAALLLLAPGVSDGRFTLPPREPDAEPPSPLTSRLVATLSADGLDWRRHGAVTPVQQQHPFGTCWSFGATGTLEGMVGQGKQRIQKLPEQEPISSCGGLKAIQGGPAPTVPWQWLVDNAGGFAQTAADYRYNHSCNLCAPQPPQPANAHVMAPFPGRG